MASTAPNVRHVSLPLRSVDRRAAGWIDDQPATVSLTTGLPDQAARDLMIALESERRRIARDLHDTVAQALAAVRMSVETAMRSGHEDATARFADSLESIDDAIAQVRSLAFSLRPPFLEERGLEAALRWLLARQAQAADLEGEFHADGHLPRVSAEVEAACYRVAQEALTNVVKHAGARRVTLDLGCSDDGIRLAVTDDGRGMSQGVPFGRDRRRLTLGIVGMRERAAALGGSLKIISRRGVGTKVIAWFPRAGRITDGLGA